MTDVINDEKAAVDLDAAQPQPGVASDELVRQLAERARVEGLRLTGEGGLLSQLTKVVVESALDGELDDHLGYSKHDPAGRTAAIPATASGQDGLDGGRSGIELEVPRDREGSFDPQLVKKRQRRLTGVDDLVISLSAKGLTHGEICAHLAEVYGASVSKQTISTITDRVIEGMAEWQSRPLDSVYPVIFIDAIIVKVRDGQRRQPADLCRDRGDGGRARATSSGCGPARRRRGGGEVLALGAHRNQKPRHRAMCASWSATDSRACPTAIDTVWPQAIMQTCVVHLLRNSFRYASRKYWAAIAKDIKPIYTAPSESAALDAFVEFTETWGDRYPAIIKLWENAWSEFVPFLDYDVEIRRVICTHQCGGIHECPLPAGDSGPRALSISYVESDWG